MFRRELTILPDLIASVPAGSVRQARQVGRHAVMVLAFLENHHHGEDDLLWPLLLERAHLDQVLLRRMEAQHEQLAEGLERMDEAIRRWTVSASAADGNELAAQCQVTAAVLMEHLDEEERYILPLARRFLTVQEWGRLAEHGQAATPGSPIWALMLLGSILEDATAEERQEFLSTVPGPGRLAWRFAGQRAYRRHVARLRKGLRTTKT